MAEVVIVSHPLTYNIYGFMENPVISSGKNKKYPYFCFNRKDREENG